MWDTSHAAYTFTTVLVVAVVPHAKLRVLECKLVTLQDGIRRHQLRVELAGQLHRTGPELQEVVVYTHYGQHVSDTITGHVELKCVDVLFVVRPHVQHMLDSLCCRQDDQHKCEVAVCTAADEAYAKAFCAALDPEKQHLLAPEARFVARAKRKKLSSVTDIPQAAVILDDCPQQAQGSTVWSVDSLHRALPIIPYIPAVDDQAMRVTLCHLHVVHKKVLVSTPRA